MGVTQKICKIQNKRRQCRDVNGQKMNTLFGSMLDAGIETKILSAIDDFFILYRRIHSWKKCFEIFIERLYQKWATGVAKIWILKCEDFVKQNLNF